MLWVMQYTIERACAGLVGWLLVDNFKGGMKRKTSAGARVRLPRRSDEAQRQLLNFP
jgi:hypothetical protein